MLHDQADLPVRLANAAIAYVKYLAMIVWPADLAVYYPYNFHPSPWQTAAAAAASGASPAQPLWCIRQSSRHTPVPATLLPSPSVGSGTWARSFR